MNTTALSTTVAKKRKHEQLPLIEAKRSKLPTKQKEAPVTELTAAAATAEVGIQSGSSSRNEFGDLRNYFKAAVPNPLNETLPVVLEGSRAYKGIRSNSRSARRGRLVRRKRVADFYKAGTSADAPTNASANSPADAPVQVPAGATVGARAPVTTKSTEKPPALCIGNKTIAEVPLITTYFRSLTNISANNKVSTNIRSYSSDAIGGNRNNKNKKNSKKIHNRPKRHTTAATDDLPSAAEAAAAEAGQFNNEFKGDTDFNKSNRNDKILFKNGEICFIDDVNNSKSKKENIKSDNDETKKVICVSNDYKNNNNSVYEVNYKCSSSFSKDESDNDSSSVNRVLLEKNNITKPAAAAYYIIHDVTYPSLGEVDPSDDAYEKTVLVTSDDAYEKTVIVKQKSNRDSSSIIINEEEIFISSSSSSSKKTKDYRILMAAVEHNNENAESKRHDEKVKKNNNDDNEDAEQKPDTDLQNGLNMKRVSVSNSLSIIILDSDYGDDGDDDDVGNDDAFNFGIVNGNGKFQEEEQQPRRRHSISTPCFILSDNKRSSSVPPVVGRQETPIKSHYTSNVLIRQIMEAKRMVLKKDYFSAFAGCVHARKINTKTRARIMEYFIETGRYIKNPISPFSVQMAINMFDRYMSHLADHGSDEMKEEAAEEIEVISAACLHLSSKLEDAWALCLGDICQTFDDGSESRRSRVLYWERNITNDLCFDVNCPTVLDFLYWMFEVATDLSRPTTCPYTKAFPSQYNSRKNFFFLTKDLLWNTAVECAERAVTTHLLLGIPSYVLAAASLLTAITFISPNMKKRLTSLPKAIRSLLNSTDRSNLKFSTCVIEELSEDIFKSDVFKKKELNLKMEFCSKFKTPETAAVAERNVVSTDQTKDTNSQPKNNFKQSSSLSKSKSSCSLSKAPKAEHLQGDAITSGSTKASL